MANLNRVFLIGNLTRDPELRYTPSGTAVVNLRMAVNRRFKDRTTGEAKDEVCFVTVVAWDRQAEVCNQYLAKGRPVFVEGRLQSRSWEGTDGQKRTVIEVRAERIQFLGAPGAGPAEARVSDTTPAEGQEEPSGFPEGTAGKNKPVDEDVTWQEDMNEKSN